MPSRSTLESWTGLCLPSEASRVVAGYTLELKSLNRSAKIVFGRRLNGGPQALRLRYKAWLVTSSQRLLDASALQKKSWGYPDWCLVRDTAQRNWTEAKRLNAELRVAAPPKKRLLMPKLSAAPPRVTGITPSSITGLSVLGWVAVIGVVGGVVYWKLR